MADTIVLGGEKGGTGKSTLVQHLVPFLANRGKKVLLVDTDPQASSGVFTQLRQESYPNLPKYDYVRIEYIEGDSAKAEQALEQLAKVKEIAQNYDYVVIDVAGNANRLLKLALIIADIAIFPFDSSGKSLNTADKVITIIKEIKIKANSSLKTFSVLSKGFTSGWLNRKTIATLNSFGKDLPYLDCAVNNRAAIVYATDEGLAVFEGKNRDYKAHNETKRFCNKVLEQLA